MIERARGNLGGGAPDDVMADRERQALQHLKQIRHPFLLSLERIEVVEDRLWIVMELADKDLATALREQQATGLAGLEREALLGYLREAAEALDLLGQQHGLYHQALRPEDSFLVSNHVKVGGFRLLRCAGDSSGAGVPQPYAAPEVARTHADARVRVQPRARSIMSCSPATGPPRRASLPSSPGSLPKIGRSSRGP